MSEFGLSSSGSMRDFGTGAVRDADASKGRPDALSAYALQRFGNHMRLGYEAYGEANWTAGIPISQLVASLERHLNAFKRGLREEDHLSAMLFNVQAIAHFEQLAKLGDATALAMLDRYASKHLAADLIYEREAMLEAESYMGAFEGEDDQRRVVGALSVYHVPTERDVLTLKPEPSFKVGDRVVTNRDITEAMILQGGLWGTRIRVPVGTHGTVKRVNVAGEDFDLGLTHFVYFANGDGWNVSSDWLNLAPEPESLIGRTVRVTCNVSKNDYFDDQVMRDGYHLYKDQTLEVVALKDDGLYICKGAKYYPYFKNVVEESGWQFEHVKPEWFEAI